jgi:hypothetical protein
VDGTADDSTWKSRSEKDCGGWGLNITPISAVLLFHYRTVPNHFQIQILPNLALPKLGLSFPS